MTSSAPASSSLALPDDLVGRANIGVVGLATMGGNLARNLARHGSAVALFNRSPQRTRDLMAAHGDEGTFIPTESITDFARALARPRTAIIMVKAGEPTDEVIRQLTEVFEPGDIIVDGGNARFTDTIRREAAAREHGLHFVGAGISGGEEGALEGPSIMPGGSVESYETLGPILASIAARVDGEPCVTHVGTDGAGHFVKMVHNGIEYADMQLIGESYDLLRRGAGMTPAEIADVFAAWNRTELDSYLIEITAEVLRQVDAETGLPLVDVIADRAGMKGTGTWTVQTALDLATPVTGIAEAVFARGLSTQTAPREAAQARFTEAQGYPGGTLAVTDRAAFVEAVRQALLAAKLVAYAQGFDEIRAGAARFGWDIDLAAIARIWRGGCIIRAGFLNLIAAAYDGDPADAPASLVLAPHFARLLDAAQGAWRQVVAHATLAGIPVPAFASSLAYFDGLRSPRLPAALVQGQRDLFGAHTYERTDRPGAYHTLWSGDRSEIRVG
ncbi:NADP-dependent phosphogluconate dehydrogenase [Pseudoclavibacter caeni]|jgi:6-phosphogluconate dehydrogenase|uniref:6-phosphogluconate dehydrogenase, decarboxylating n=1 Tax=Pseudoclavibacter caeni TaxID=908846 RepID=A0A7C8FQC4_9MICO|nr:NADP-dependent phosphogluconate dehydrogenase [Pseudoclavibacter caeni]KAB1631319.1 NADP-dependent phosphogluconate dehydrogenase [Pseudoclavibacter caeni]NYJ96704.1 6-phosphogluconate dehydrogenase [Pseudoclavibacter caeni]